MRFRTRLGLVARAVAALAVQTGLLAAVGTLLAIGGGILGLAVAGLVSSLAGQTLPLWGFPVAVVAGVTVTVSVWVNTARREFRHGRVRLLRDTRDPEVETAEERRAAETAGRFAQQTDVSAPEVLVRETEDPHCYTVPRPDGPALVVSTGLLGALSPAETEAVLAHEVAHLANRDHRVMTTALAPLVAAEELADTVDDDTSDPREVVWVLLYGALVWWGPSASASSPGAGNWRPTPRRPS